MNSVNTQRSLGWAPGAARGDPEFTCTLTCTERALSVCSVCTSVAWMAVQHKGRPQNPELVHAC
jgi:hypothetical protein